MKKKTLGIIAISVLGATAIFCSAMFTHQYLDAKNSKSAFDDLTNLITEIDEPQKDTEAEESDLSAEELAAAEAVLAREKYTALFAQNNDFIGWIRIDGTNVNYPVMQTPNKPDFYLKRSFDKSYSDYGVPYIDEACMTGISNNLVIYGHHMNDGSMFADLCKYTDADFCKEHPRRTGSTAMKSASTKMKNGFAAMRRSCVGARQAERRERRLHGRRRGKIRRPHGQASGADETRPSNLRSVPNAPSSSLFVLPGNRP